MVDLASLAAGLQGLPQVGCLSLQTVHPGLDGGHPVDHGWVLCSTQDPLEEEPDLGRVFGGWRLAFVLNQLSFLVPVLEAQDQPAPSLILFPQASDEFGLVPQGGLEFRPFLTLPQQDLFQLPQLPTGASCVSGPLPVDLYFQNFQQPPLWLVGTRLA